MHTYKQAKTRLHSDAKMIDDGLYDMRMLRSELSLNIFIFLCSLIFSLSGLHRNRRQLGVLSPWGSAQETTQTLAHHRCHWRGNCLFSRSSSIFDRELKYDPWSKVWLLTLALCSSLTALAEYGWLIHQREEEIEQDCQKNWWRTSWKMTTKKAFLDDWLWFFEPILLCFPESGESAFKFVSTWLAFW